MRKYYRTVRAAAIMLVAIGAAAVMGVAPAYADRNIPPPPVGSTYAWYTNNGVVWTDRKCMEVGGWRTDDFAPVNQYECHWGANQQWRFGYATTSHDSYYLQNVNSGKCLEVYGYGVNYGDPIVQYPCHLGTNQRWELIWNYEEDYGNLRNVNSGLCLSVDGLSSANLTRLVQNRCYPFTNQLFSPVYIR